MSERNPARGRKWLTDHLPPTRTFAVAVVVGGMAAAAIIATGAALFGWDPGPVDQYKLTNALANVIGRWPLVVGGAVLLLLVPFDWRAYYISVPMVACPFLAAIIYEITQNASSHNLLPFEIVRWLVLSIVVHIPSMVAHWIFSRASDEPDVHAWDISRDR